MAGAAAVLVPSLLPVGIDVAAALAAQLVPIPRLSREAGDPAFSIRYQCPIVIPVKYRFP